MRQSNADLDAARCRHCRPRRATATGAWRTKVSGAVVLVAALAD